MKTSVISPEFHERYLANPDDPYAFEGRVVVFDGGSFVVDDTTTVLSWGLVIVLAGTV